MTGIGMAASSGATAIQPLTCSYSLNTAATVINVAGASGDLATANGLAFVSTVTGGVPPYFDNGSAFSFDGGSTGNLLTYILASDGVHNTVAWSGMASVGDVATFHFDQAVRDSDTPPATATYRYPPTGVIALHRTT